MAEFILRVVRLRYYHSCAQGKQI